MRVVTLEGSPYEQGCLHGEALEAEIAENLELYLAMFRDRLGLGRDEILDAAAEYARSLEEHSRDYLAAVRGVAEASGQDVLELVALNVRYEIVYHRLGVAPTVDGCTSFAVLPAETVDGHTVMGQTWDWVPGVRGAVLHAVDPDGTETAGYTEAGVVGAKIGLNAAGVGLAINGLLTTAPRWDRLSVPFHVRCHTALRATTLEGAIAAVSADEPVCSANFLLATAGGEVADVELAPDGANVLGCEDGRLVHANHFVDPEAVGVTEPTLPFGLAENSRRRQQRLGDLIRRAAPLSAATARAMLSDHDGFPQSICRHPDPTLPDELQAVTVASVVMDLDERTLWVTDGPPCRAAWTEVTVGATRG